MRKKLYFNKEKCKNIGKNEKQIFSKKIGILKKFRNSVLENF